VRFSPVVDRIAGEQTGAWRVHAEGMRRREAGHDIIFLTVGDPDQAAPAPVVEATIEALRRNRTGYSPIIDYPRVRAAEKIRDTRTRTRLPGLAAAVSSLQTGSIAQISRRCRNAAL
jgi:aspartate/methionine/tyrosine aminotransferase